MTAEKEQRLGWLRAAAFLCRFRHASQYLHSIAAIPCHSSKSLTKVLNFHHFLIFLENQSIHCPATLPALFSCCKSLCLFVPFCVPNFTVTSQLRAAFSPKSSHESISTLQLQNTPSVSRLLSASGPAAGGYRPPPQPPAYRPASQPPVWDQAPPHNRSSQSCAGSSAA